jgi:SAM-dependent methyltransferase
MRNRDSWIPSKFVYKNGRLVAARNPKEDGMASRLIADLTASLYDTYIKEYCKGKLIDLGCGNVPLYEAYRDYTTDNICVDWSNTQHKNKYLDFECDLTRNLPFRENEFNTIILADVLEHIPQPEHLWKEMGRILAADGKILLSVPFYYWLHEVPYDYYRYTEWALRRFAESEGFKILLLKAIGGSPEILADILAKHLQYVPLLGQPLSIGIQYVTYAFVRTKLGKRISERTSQSFPLGYFMVAEKE